MQISGINYNVNKLADYARRQEFIERHGAKYQQVVQQWESLKRKGLAEADIAEFLSISRATFYRYKSRLAAISSFILPSRKKRLSTAPKRTDEIKSLVFLVRKENDTYGKTKIAAVLQRDHGLEIGASTVGRILKEFMDAGRIIRSRSAPRAKKRRSFNKHAKRWAYDLRPKSPGEMIQIDHMSVTKNGVKAKHFQAWDPMTKVMFANIYSNATAKNAAKFLDYIKEQLPFNIKSIQVDGGSEFMKEFEEKCAEDEIPLFVLPPSRPQYNGGVERGNRICREEFYDSPNTQPDSIIGLRGDLQKFIHKYNNFRPHFSNDNLTPICYFNNTWGKSQLT